MPRPTARLTSTMATTDWRRRSFPAPRPTTPSSTTDYEQVGYDANGNVTTFRTRRNETLTMTFDNLNRLIRKTVPERTGLARTYTRDVFYGHDLHGGLVWACFGDATNLPETPTSDCVDNPRDALGRPTGTTLAMDGVSRTLSYGYDVAGNRMM